MSDGADAPFHLDGALRDAIAGKTEMHDGCSVL